MRMLLLGALVLVAVKLALVAAQPIKAVATGSFDDALFIGLARQISLGNWLGDYTNLTLAKGPGAPLFIALSHAIRIPLPVAQHLLHAFACLLAVFAMRPVVQRDGWLLAAFAFMLFNPMTFDAGIMTRVSRSHVYASAILITLVSITGLATWRCVSRRTRLPWIAAAGLAAGWAWITREETVMILPALLVAAAGLAFWLAKRDSPGEVLSFAGDLIAAGSIAALFVACIAAINYANYGAFVITEIRGGAFARAYGALSRIPPVDDAEYVALTDEARRTAYRVSPAFRELEPYLEGPRGDFWISESRFFVGLPTRGRGFHRGWFMWAFRDAVADAGYYTSAAAAAAYYDRIADEIDKACGNPSLRCGPPRSTPRPALDISRAMRVAGSGWSSLLYLLTFDEFTGIGVRSLGTEEAVAEFREWTRWTTQPVGEDPVVGPRNLILHRVGRAFGLLTPILALASLLAWIAALVAALRARALEPLLVLATAALVLTISSVGVVAMVDGLAFPAINILYLAPAYPALFLFVASSFCAFAETGRRAWIGPPRG